MRRTRSHAAALAATQLLLGCPRAVGVDASADVETVESDATSEVSPESGTVDRPRARALTLGQRFACAIIADGTLRCWGSNIYGMLGGDAGSGSLPVAVTSVPPRATSLDSDSFYACAVVSDGEVWCWGQFLRPDGTQADHSAPAAIADLPNRVTAVATGYRHTCVAAIDGAAWCWGNNRGGQLGIGIITDLAQPPSAVTGLPSPVVALSAGVAHTCAALADGAIWCWGNNADGQLGDGTTMSQPSPVAVNGLPTRVVALAAGSRHTCAALADGTAWCWGRNAEGQLGEQTSTGRTTAVAVRGLPTRVRSIAGGVGHTCALLDAGTVWCWGDNNGGQLGDGTTVNRRSPVEVAGLPSRAIAIAADLDTCAVLEDGAVWCWGGISGATAADGGGLQLRTTPMRVEL